MHNLLLWYICGTIAGKGLSSLRHLLCGWQFHDNVVGYQIRIIQIIPNRRWWLLSRQRRNKYLLFDGPEHKVCELHLSTKYRWSLRYYIFLSLFSSDILWLLFLYRGWRQSKNRCCHCWAPRQMPSVLFLQWDGLGNNRLLQPLQA